MPSSSQTSDREVLSHCWKVRQLLASFQNIELELSRDAELLQR